MNVIDFYALNDPVRVWASAPVDDNNLAKGFRYVTYKELANAVSRASWWIKENFVLATSSQIIAYAGQMTCDILFSLSQP